MDTPTGCTAKQPHQTHSCSNAFGVMWLNYVAPVLLHKGKYGHTIPCLGFEPCCLSMCWCACTLACVWDVQAYVQCMLLRPCNSASLVMLFSSYRILIKVTSQLSVKTQMLGTSTQESFDSCYVPLNLNVLRQLWTYYSVTIVMCCLGIGTYKLLPIELLTYCNEPLCFLVNQLCRVSELVHADVVETHFS